MAKLGAFGFVAGLGFNVEKSDTASGFRPALVDNSGVETWGDLRLLGLAAGFRLGHYPFIALIGGDEVKIGTNRAEAMAEMLIKDHGVPEQYVRWQSSVGNTRGNASVMKLLAAKLNVRLANAAWMTNIYHMPRAGNEFRDAGIFSSWGLCAEALIIAENPSRQHTIYERLGRGPLARRYILEIFGIAAGYKGEKIMPEPFDD